MYNCSPVMQCHGLGSDNEIYMKRDDLLPFSFGGNKLRIAQEFFEDMHSQGKRCIIGYGNVRSNLCRVIANMSYSVNGEGFCHIITALDENESNLETFNSMIVEGCKAKIHYCSKTNVAETVNAVIEECRSAGEEPYYIYGDVSGHGNEAVPVRAYAKAYSEIETGFDYIFLATGTGMTQAGLLAGKIENGGKEQIVGISVARDKDKVREVISKDLAAYFSDTSVQVDDKDIIVSDDYLCGGYGRASYEVNKTIKEMMLKNGVPLDPTYTGKAFYGMLDYIRKNNICGKKILFIHTGGAPLFFDNAKDVFNDSFSREQLHEFIVDIDKELPVPLSDRVDLSEYSKKLYEKAHLKTVVSDGKIVSLIAGYTENITDNLSYITLVGTLPKMRGKGLAKKLMLEYIRDCEKKGISGIHLHTKKTNQGAVSLYTGMGFVPYSTKNEPKPNDLHLIYWIKKEKK